MPAETERQRVAAAIALHSPEKLHSENRGMLSMSKDKLRHFATKPTKKKRRYYKPN